ncbi:MAG: efflux RND transporter permease subunit [Myxococcales bacterium]
MSGSRADGFFDRLVDFQTRRPWVPLLGAGAVCLAGALLTSRLELRTRYEALLPEQEPSVQELRRIEKRLPAAQTVLILLEGTDRASLRAFGDALVPRLLALGPDIVSSAEDGPHELRAFLAPRAALFLDLPELRQLAADVEARWSYEVEKASGLMLLDEEAPPPISAADWKRRASARARGADLDRFPAGYYERGDGSALVVIARSPIAGGDLARIGPALRRIEDAVAALRRSSPAFGAVRVSYAGDMPTGFIEYGVVRDDLLSVGATGIALVLAAVLLYFLRLRAVVVMGLAIGAGLLWTFGLTELCIGHLNVATAFLISIVAGNGINVGILFQSRYFEERRRGDPPAQAVRTAMRATWQPTLIAAVAAAASYGSLLVTEFRAFRDFGFIAASGMLLCWAVTILCVPPLLLLVDRRRERELPRPLRGLEMGYGRVFAWLAPKAPRAVVAAGLLLGGVGAVAGIRYALSDPMEYDLDRVQNDRHRTAELHRAWAGVTDILGASQAAMVVLTDTAEEARELESRLRARWDRAPADQKPFVAVHSLWDLVPPDQAAKLPIALELGDRLRRARRRGFIGDADWAELAELVPPAGLQPFGLADLPQAVARPFSEKDGRRGTLVLVDAEPTRGNDLHYLLRYADSFRETRLASGALIRGSGRAVVFADMLRAVVRDIPRAVSLSLALTLLVVFLTFRRGAQTLPVLLTLAVAVAGVAAFLYFGGRRLNFMNFSALPVTFGIGVDYAINVAQRYHADGRRDVVSALRTSGGAVVLCSLTTMLGYLVLLGSSNLGIRSLGELAAVGEVSCLLAAVVFLPALYLTLGARRARTSPT